MQLSNLRSGLNVALNVTVRVCLYVCINWHLCANVSSSVHFILLHLCNLGSLSSLGSEIVFCVNKIGKSILFYYSCKNFRCRDTKSWITLYIPNVLFRHVSNIEKSEYWPRHVSVCLSVCPGGRTRLSLEGFSWNLILEYFSNICREYSNLIKILQEWGYCTWYFMIWYDMIWYDMIWYDMIWYDMILYDMIWYNMIWYVMWYDIYDILYDIWYDMIYDMLWYNIWHDMTCYDIWTIYLLIATGFTSGGSNRVHIYTQTINRTIQLKTIYRTTQLTTNWEECGPCPVFASCTLAFA
jgi:hypothetical protein